MTPNERKKFDEFADSVNKEIPHPQDEKRWRDFIRQAHDDQSPTDRGEVERELIDKGFPSDAAAKYGEQYEDGRKLLEGE